MSDDERAEFRKKWEEAKKDIESRLGAGEKSDWNKFVEVFEVSAIR